MTHPASHQAAPPDLQPGASRAQVLDSARDAIIATDSNFEIAVWNEAAELMYGWSAHEVIGHPLREIIRTDFAGESNSDVIMNALHKQGYQRFEFVHYHRNGQPLIVESTVMVLRDPMGTVSGYVSVNRDVSEGRGAALALEQSERRFRALVEHSRDVITLLTAEGTIIYSTPSMQSILGYTFTEFIGASVFDFAHPNEIEALRALQDHLLSRHGMTMPISLRVRHRDGSWRWIEGTVTNLFGEPSVAATVVNYRDVTRRKNAEESLRLTSERLKILLDMDRAILAARSPEEIANAALSRLMRLTPCQRATVLMHDTDSEDAILISALDSHASEPEKDSSRFSLCHFSESERDGLRQGEIQLINNLPERISAAPFWEKLWNDGIRAYVSVPLVAENQLIGSLELCCEQSDFSNSSAFDVWREVAGRLAVAISQARLHRQVHEGQRELQSLSRQLIETQEAERRHLAHELHDEVGQALTAIKLALQYAQNQQDEAAKADTLHDCIEIVDDALSRVRSLSLDLRPSLLDDLGLVAALRWYLDRQTGRTNVEATFSAHGFEETPTSMGQKTNNRFPTGIETACFRVAQEAVTNVLRHANARKVEVKLQRKDNALELIVQDDGQGFNSEEARRRATRGGSLGLLGMEERVRLVGGTFALDSTPGRGTRVQARFPLDSFPS